MPRPLCEDSIRRRVVIAYHRAQALARNLEYQSNLSWLQRHGYGFGDDGLEDTWPLGERGQRAREIRERAGLVFLILPWRLRKLTIEEIERYDKNPLFVDVPGWEVVRVSHPHPGDYKVPDLGNLDGVRWYTPRAVPLRHLRKRHRLASYDQIWAVHDLWGYLRGMKGWEHKISDIVWPGRWEGQLKEFPFSEKLPIRQHLRDLLQIARDFIGAAYLPEGISRQ